MSLCRTNNKAIKNSYVDKSAEWPAYDKLFSGMDVISNKIKYYHGEPSDNLMDVPESRFVKSKADSDSLVDEL